jgi:hypothetical protein
MPCQRRRNEPPNRRPAAALYRQWPQRPLRLQITYSVALCRMSARYTMAATQASCNLQSLAVASYFIARLMRSLHALNRTADSLRFNARPIAFALFLPAILRNIFTWAAVQ